MVPEWVTAACQNDFQKLFKHDDIDVDTDKPWLDLPIWEEYKCNINKFADRHGSLTDLISMVELEFNISNFKNNFAPGVDSVVYEVYKVLNLKGKMFLLNLLNAFLVTGISNLV